MAELLSTRVCDLTSSTNTQTVEEYVRELEDRAGALHENLLVITEEQLDEYIEWLYLACMM